MKRFRMPTAYTILFILLILVAAATWLIPAGSYTHGEDGAPLAGSYHQVERRTWCWPPLRGFTMRWMWRCSS